MVFTIGLGDTILQEHIPGASFFLMMIVIIKSSPETIKQISFLLNYEVNNSIKSGRAGIEPTVCSYHQHSALCTSIIFVVVLRPYTPVPTINKAVIIPIFASPFHEISTFPCRFSVLFRESLGRLYEIFKHDSNAPRTRTTKG